MILNAYQVISAIIADLLIVIIWNFFCRNFFSLILQLRTKDQVPLTSPGDYQKNFLLTKKVHLIYFLAGTTDFFYNSLSMGVSVLLLHIIFCLFIFIEKQDFFCNLIYFMSSNQLIMYQCMIFLFLKSHSTVSLIQISHEESSNFHPSASQKCCFI